SQVNFFLLRDPDIENQEELLLFLLKNGIVPRHTENYPYLEGHYLRFAIRPLDEMNQLLEVLKKWKER
ncbi:MAG: threonine-phosphate decarboxylase, partial [Atopostipes suicloacalis]|nr:threonine-phosphate decarboxylase [Atopostipes suicloacalis]